MKEKGIPNILFLHPGLIHNPNLPNFRNRFEMLSKCTKGLIITRTIEGSPLSCSFKNYTYSALMRAEKGIKNKLSFIAFAIKKAKKYHKENPIDLIICYDSMYTGIIGTILKAILKSKLIIEINSEYYFGAIKQFHDNSFTQNTKSLFFKIISNFTLSSSNAIKVLTNDFIKTLPSHLQNKNIFSFHDYVPTEIFISQQGEMKPYLLFIGFPFKLKGVEKLIRAFTNISHDFPEFKLVLIGHKLKEDALKIFPKLSDKIIFHPGLYYNDLIEHFRSCYLFVLPSLTEGLPRVLIEAMASQKAIIASNVGGISSLVKEGKNGYLINPDNSEDLKKKLKNLINNPGLCSQMGVESKKMVIERFSDEKYYEHFICMIRDVLK
jgi:glycosyltransferase involved in cell wall biosynthesis